MRNMGAIGTGDLSGIKRSPSTRTSLEAMMVLNRTHLRSAGAMSG